MFVFLSGAMFGGVVSQDYLSVTLLPLHHGVTSDSNTHYTLMEHQELDSLSSIIREHPIGATLVKF